MTIAELPDAPDPANDSAAEFSTKAAAFVLAQRAMVPEINAALAGLTSIAAGGGFSIPYTFSSTITDADPGDGLLRLSSATQNASTTMRADLTSALSQDVTAMLNSFDDSTSSIKGQIRLVKVGDPTKWLAFNITAAASPSGYRNFTVAHVSGSAASPFTNGDSLILLFTRNGDTGINDAPGLVLVATLTPTAVASLDFLNTFSSAYDNYLILIDGVTCASNDSLRLRLATAGAPDAGSSYTALAASSTAVTSAGSFMSLSPNMLAAATGGTTVVVEIMNVNDTTRLKAAHSRAIFQSALTPGYTSYYVDTAFPVAAVVTGFHLYFGTGVTTFGATGKVRVYGYVNS